MNTSIAIRRPNWAALLAVIVLGTIVVLALTPLRQPVLRALGWTLVADATVASADIIVVSIDSGGAGALEAADLVHAGIATRVAVFVDPPSGEDFEFIRRGLPYEDAAARQIRQLQSLGVTDIVRIPAVDIGTEREGQVLSSWCAEHRIRSLVFVVARDHSRRAQRVMDRTMKGLPVRVTVLSARHSSFDPDNWWETRTGLRTGIIELQKMLLDVLRHPLPPW